MYKNLDDYLQQKRDLEAARKRKLNILRQTLRNGDSDEIIAVLTELSALGVNFRNANCDLLLEYLSIPRAIDTLVVMHLLNMGHRLTAQAVKKAYARQSDSEEERAMLTQILTDAMRGKPL